jgi:hypothetical protein
LGAGLIVNCNKMTIEHTIPNNSNDLIYAGAPLAEIASCPLLARKKPSEAGGVYGKSAELVA